MTYELARTHLRGWYAIVAGILLSVGVALYQSFVLAPLGYIEAVRAAARANEFSPLIVWLGQHPGTAFGFRVLQLVPFLLALALPQTLRRVLPGFTSRLSALMVWCGRIGVACYALALVLGLVTSITAAGNADTAAAAAAYANSYAVQTIISRVVGGLLLTFFILLVCLGMARSPLLPDWLGFAGLLVAAILAATAFQFVGNPLQVETPLSPWSFVLLSAWLVAIGVLLVRLKALPSLDESATAAVSDTSRGRNAPGTSHPADGQ